MNRFLAAIPRYAKSVAGGITALGGALGLALADQEVTLTEWIGIVSATLVGAGVVAAVPNRPKDTVDRLSRESVEAMARRARE